MSNYEKPESAPNKKRGPDKSSKRQIAEQGGMSRSQMYRAEAVSNISDEEFERLVESEEPPTVTELVRIGRGRKKKPKEGKVTIPEELWTPLEDFANENNVSPHDVVRGLVIDYLERKGRH